jgi:hypothetical protein
MDATASDARARPRHGWVPLAVALLLTAVSVGAFWGQRATLAWDARLGADVLVAPAGPEVPRGSLLLMDVPRTRALDAATVAAIQRSPGVAAVVPLYNLGRLSAQECPA